MKNIFNVLKILCIVVIIIHTSITTVSIVLVIVFFNLLYEIKLLADRFAMTYKSDEFDQLIKAINDEIEQITPKAKDYSKYISKINSVLNNYDVNLEFISINETSQRLIFEYKLGHIIKSGKKQYTKIADVRAIINELELALNTQVELIKTSGKIGLAIRNPERKTLSFGEVVNNKQYKKFIKESELPFILGVDQQDNPVYGDLIKAPHLLIAGETNSGKSNALQVLLTALLLNKTPNELKLLLADFKLVELSVFKNSKYLLDNIAYEIDDFEKQLIYLENEMVKRNKLMFQTDTKTIMEYNNKFPTSKLNYIVFVVEELSAVMLIEDKKQKTMLENKLAKLASQCRSAGIHIIITTQKPVSEVLTGTIKANIPSRLALKVTSNVDSQLILDKGGAEKLLGNGDALLRDRRFQVAFLNGDEQRKYLYE